MNPNLVLLKKKEFRTPTNTQIKIIYRYGENLISYAKERGLRKIDRVNAFSLTSSHLVVINLFLLSNHICGTLLCQSWEQIHYWQDYLWYRKCNYRKLFSLLQLRAAKSQQRMQNQYNYFKNLERISTNQRANERRGRDWSGWIYGFSQANL